MASTLSRLSEASTTCLMCSGRLFRSVHLPPSLGLVSHPEFGRDDYFAAKRSERFAYQFFVHGSGPYTSAVSKNVTPRSTAAWSREIISCLSLVAHRTSSFPCSQIRWPKLPGCFFRVCVSALRFFLSLRCYGGRAGRRFPDPANSLPDPAWNSDFVHREPTAAVA